jgi:hypothetical protein
MTSPTKTEPWIRARTILDLMRASSVYGQACPDIVMSDRGPLIVLQFELSGCHYVAECNPTTLVCEVALRVPDFNMYEAPVHWPTIPAGFVHLSDILEQLARCPSLSLKAAPEECSK